VSERPTLVYLEADDEVTTVVRRIREADGQRVVLVVPGRSRATSSAVALRLLARVGEEAGVGIAVSGDALTRSLAAEAGLETYASVEDARNAVPATLAEPGSRHASIHVVRGATADGTAPTRAVVTPVPAGLEDPTQARPVASTRAAERSRRGPPAAGILALLLGLVVVGGILVSVVLPAATIEITPRTEPIGPLEYEIDLADAERTTGTAEASATVSASGTYTAQVAATGNVTLFNWTALPVNVPAGTLVATGNQPGDQAFATQAGVVVPRGTLTPQGTIAAGDIVVAVAAAAVGPAANVGPDAIDTVLTQAVDQQLRGFPENPERRVQNFEPTVGGLDTTGPEITQADVDAAVATLNRDLAAQAEEALGSNTDLLWADAVPAPEPVIDGVDGLVGTRDQAQVEIGGSLAYDRLSVERTTVIDRAEERLAADVAALPNGHDVVPAVTSVTIGNARIEGDRLVVAVSVTGASARRPDSDGILDRVRGRSRDEAEAALGELGEVNVELWPGWVTSVPQLDWRIDLRLHSAPDDPASSPSATP
jgi:hypothetical protein